MLEAFLVANWQSVVIAVVFIVASVVLWVKGYKKNVAMYILQMVAIAESKFEHGDNKTKAEYVLNELYAKLPPIVTFFISKQTLVLWIDKIVADTKEWLQNQSK